MTGREICAYAQNQFGAAWRSELCSVLSVSLKTVYRWENGETEPLKIYSDLFEKFAKKLDARKNRA